MFICCSKGRAWSYANHETAQTFIHVPSRWWSGAMWPSMRAAFRHLCASLCSLWFVSSAPWVSSENTKPPMFTLLLCNQHPSPNIGGCTRTRAICRTINMIKSVYPISATLAEICCNTCPYFLTTEQIGYDSFFQPSMSIPNKCCFWSRFWPLTDNSDCVIIWTNSVAPKSLNYRLATVLCSVLVPVYLVY